jgi:hypothetical protein
MSADDWIEVGQLIESDLATRGLDGGKLLTRIDADDARRARTLEASARAVTELAQHHLMAMIEPSWGKALTLPSVRGLVVGRALLFPPDGEIAATVDVAAELVHGGA